MSSRLIPAPVYPLNRSQPTHPARTPAEAGLLSTFSPPPNYQKAPCSHITPFPPVLLWFLPIVRLSGLRFSPQPGWESGQSPAVASQPTHSKNPQTTKEKWGGRKKKSLHLGANFQGRQGRAGRGEVQQAGASRGVGREEVTHRALPHMEGIFVRSAALGLLRPLLVTLRDANGGTAL